MKRNTNPSMFCRISRTTIYYIAKIIADCIEAAYWIFRIMFTYSSHFNKRVVRKHPIAWKIHDCIISACLGIGFFLVVGSTGMFENSTTTGIEFLYDTIAFVACFGAGMLIITILGYFNDLFICDDDEYDVIDDYDMYEDPREIDLPNNKIRHIEDYRNRR